MNGHTLPIGHANHAWLCLNLLNVLCQLAERGHATSVRSMLDYPIKHCPEVLLLGMACINVLSLIYLLFKKKKILLLLCIIVPYILSWLINFVCVISDCI